MVGRKCLHAPELGPNHYVVYRFLYRRRNLNIIEQIMKYLVILRDNVHSDCWSVGVQSDCWSVGVQSERWLVGVQSERWLVGVQSECWSVSVQSECWTFTDLMSSPNLGQLLSSLGQLQRCDRPLRKYSGPQNNWRPQPHFITT